MASHTRKLDPNSASQTWRVWPLNNKEVHRPKWDWESHKYDAKSDPLTFRSRLCPNYRPSRYMKNLKFIQSEDPQKRRVIAGCNFQI